MLIYQKATIHCDDKQLSESFSSDSINNESICSLFNCYKQQIERWESLVLRKGKPQINSVYFLWENNVPQNPHNECRKKWLDVRYSIHRPYAVCAIFIVFHWKIMCETIKLPMHFVNLMWRGTRDSGLNQVTTFTDDAELQTKVPLRLWYRCHPFALIRHGE